LLRLLELLYQSSLLGQFLALGLQFLLLLFQELLHSFQCFLDILVVS